MKFAISLVGNFRIEKVRAAALLPSAVEFLEVPNYFLLFVVLDYSFLKIWRM
jgi:hypothetical protein